MALHSEHIFHFNLPSSEGWNEKARNAATVNRAHTHSVTHLSLTRQSDQNELTKASKAAVEIVYNSKSINIIEFE